MVTFHPLDPIVTGTSPQILAAQLNSADAAS
jgi:hypothetical protein